MIDDEDDDRTQAAGAKAPIQVAACSARLKSCPDTKQADLGGNRQADPGGNRESDGRADLSGLRPLLGLPECDGCAAGSNNWAISGRHTASGKPLLSNDMHLGLTEPNIWYMADLRAPGFHAAPGKSRPARAL